VAIFREPSLARAAYVSTYVLNSTCD